MIADEDTLHHIALAIVPGPIAPFWGVVDGLYDCAGNFFFPMNQPLTVP